MPHPVEYTAQLHRELINGLTIGLTQREACARAGLPWSTWCKWRKRIRERDHFHDGVKALVEESKKAVAAGTAANLALVRSHADGQQTKGDPRAAMYLVTRRDEHDERVARRRKAKADALRAELALERERLELETLRRAGSPNGTVTVVVNTTSRHPTVDADPSAD